MITQEHLNNAMDYGAYRRLLEELLAKGMTTGHTQSEQYLAYAKINLQRMARLDKTASLLPELTRALEGVTRQHTWLVITEGWCGDAAQNIPVFHLVEKHCPSLEMRLLLRDENPQVMEQFLTNGARSIPKLVCLDTASLQQVFTWGPRPAALQEIVMDLKKRAVTPEEKGLVVQRWYNDDRTVSLQKELLHLIYTFMIR